MILGWCIARIGEVVGAFLGREGAKNFADCGADGFA
jgi:hypothetical protein